jgi:D-arabinonate dehydratase
VRIADITVSSYRRERAKPLRNAKHTYRWAELDVIRVGTDEGMTGIALAEHGHRLTSAFLDLLKPKIVGLDPLCVEKLWHLLWIPKEFGRRGLETRVISSIDIAMWDLRAKILGLPVHTLLGGYRDSIPIYVAGGYYEDGADATSLARELERSLGLGAKAVKIKIGGQPMRQDVERVKTARNVIGPDVMLAVDANNAYLPHEAIRVARAIEDLDIAWFEEPVSADDYAGQGAVVAAIGIPVASGENEYTRYGFRDLIEHRSAAILNPDAGVLGGVSEFMKVAALASAHNVAIAPHGSQQTHVHLTCAISNGLILEYYPARMDPFWGMTGQPLPIRDGYVAPPSEPGFGFELDEAALEPFRVRLRS